jgi:HTH-type transcriptional regulator / antitoxin HigA
MIKTSGKPIVKANVDTKKYAHLLTSTLPAVIETEEQNERALSVVEQLMNKGQNISREEETLLQLLSYLIKEFEQKYYQPEDATPHEVLTELIAANNLKRVDLLPVFGSKGIASEVINGKRTISKAHAKALAEFFNVPADLFL